jgi:hypothetical protein
LYICRLWAHIAFFLFISFFNFLSFWSFVFILTLFYFIFGRCIATFVITTVFLRFFGFFLNQRNRRKTLWLFESCWVICLCFCGLECRCFDTHTHFMFCFCLSYLVLDSPGAKVEWLLLFNLVRVALVKTGVLTVHNLLPWVKHNIVIACKVSWILYFFDNAVFQLLHVCLVVYVA